MIQWDFDCLSFEIHFLKEISLIFLKIVISNTCARPRPHHPFCCIVELLTRCGRREERVTASLRQWHCTAMVQTKLHCTCGSIEPRGGEEGGEGGKAERTRGIRAQNAEPHIGAPLYLPAYERDIGERVSRLDFAERSSVNTYTIHITPGVSRFSQLRTYFFLQSRITVVRMLLDSILHGSVSWSGTLSNFSFIMTIIYVLCCFYLLSFSSYFFNKFFLLF